MQKVWNRVAVHMLLRRYPQLEQGNHGLDVNQSLQLKEYKSIADYEDAWKYSTKNDQKIEKRSIF